MKAALTSVLLTVIAAMAQPAPRYFVQGEVARPGAYDLAVPTKVLAALVNSGGFRPDAHPDGIIIVRQENSATRRLRFNYQQVVKSIHPEQNIFLKPGDVIVVR